MDNETPTPTPIVQPIVVPTSNNIKYIIIFGCVVLLGVVTGFGFSKIKSAPGGGPVVNGQKVEVVNTPGEEGVKDMASFKNISTETGELKINDGKITTEGSYILVRPGGVSQNIYLTSSVIDLEKYVGKKIQIWGETFKGQKAGWLMDVIKIKVVN
ncbi:MAG: hypothetical protein Q7S14_00170 [bacterium]|nr:hypothetical protein [bacterium]